MEMRKESELSGKEKLVVGLEDATKGEEREELTAPEYQQRLVSRVILHSVTKLIQLKEGDMGDPTHTTQHILCKEGLF